MARKAISGKRQNARNSLRRDQKRRLCLEGLERRELFAFTPGVPNPLPTPVPVLEIEPNDRVDIAQVLNLGTSTGQVTSINLSGAVSAGTTFAGSGIPYEAFDADYFRVQLRAGDILDISVSGAAAAIDLLDANGSLVMGSNFNRADTPLNGKSPLQTTGNALLQLVVPVTGTYTIVISSDYNQSFVPPIPPQNGPYTANLRVYRPAIEQQPVGSMQTLYLDFDGEIIPRNLIPGGTTGTGRFRGISEFMEAANINPIHTNRLIDIVVATVKENFNDVGLANYNGNFAVTGSPGSYGINIVDSRSANVWGQTNVSRVVLAGFSADYNDPVTPGPPVYGIAQSIDVGNFDTEESAFIFFDTFYPFVGLTFGIDPGSDVVTVLGKWLGNVVSHEASHFFGLRHTNNLNNVYSLIDAGGNNANLLRSRIGVGLDGIFGTSDDDDPDFVRDLLYENGNTNNDPFFGYQDSPRVLAHTLVTGTIGGTISGRVYNDLNSSGSFTTGETGISGVTVFVDKDGDGVLDDGEARAVTDANGLYSLPAVAGTYNVRAQLPTNYQTSGVTTRSVTVTTGQSASNIDFGFTTRQQRSGTVFTDANGSGVRETGEGGIGGVLLYVDLNNDDLPSLGEPQVISAADGSYSLTFPGTGNYTIRAQIPSGYTITTPSTGEYTNVPAPLTRSDYDFGFRASRDYGDLPAPYATTVAQNGPSHGIVAGLGLGALIDADTDGQPSLLANGDDIAGITSLDDEDGVLPLTPFTKGATAQIQVTTRNSTGQAAGLHGWIDFNGDGDFTDAGEKIINNLVVGTATTPIPVPIPANAVNVLHARFRYAYDATITSTGFTPSGEVEDYQFFVAATSNIVNDDTRSVPVNSVDFPLDVLVNDFDPPQAPLRITQVGQPSQGTVVISSDQRSLRYTPPAGYRGQVTFNYVVNGALIDSAPLSARTANVTVNVQFQAATVIAIDDSFEVSEGVSNFPLDVLDNDIPGLSGTINVISARMLEGSGSVVPASGGSAVRYSAPSGLTGTEQFEYTVSDGSGNTATAIGTVHLLPGDLADNWIEFNIRPVNAAGGLLTTIPAGEDFDVEVRVKDLGRRNPGETATILGVGSAYLDLLYSADLVRAVNELGSTIGADVTFSGTFPNARTGNAQIPGIINEVGAAQSLSPVLQNAGDSLSTSLGLLLFKVKMRAETPGVAKFIGDPADSTFSDTSLINPVADQSKQRLQFNGSTLTIVPAGGNFAYAVDDNFIDPIPNTRPTNLDVLDNDSKGPGGELLIVGTTAPAHGKAEIDNRGTSSPDDDLIIYSPFTNFNGTDQFTYTVQALDGAISRATVTVQVGDPATILADDRVLLELSIVDTNGNPISGDLNVGEKFKLRATVQDLRPNPTGIIDRRGVYAAFMDIIYNQNLATVSKVKAAADQLAGLNTDEATLGFDIDFEAPYDSNIISGDTLFPNMINDVGSVQINNNPLSPTGDPLGNGKYEMFEITFTAKASGLLTFTADPANENLPFTDTLLFEPPTPPMLVNQIRFTEAMVNIVVPTPEFTNPVNSMDVNNDGGVTPIDALLVINRLNTLGSGSLAAGEATSSNASKLYIDTNADNFLSPLDALIVINGLNRIVSQQVPAGEATSATMAAASHDTATAVLSSDDDAVAHDVALMSVGASSAPSLLLEALNDADEDEDEESLLDALASDIASLDT